MLKFTECFQVPDFRALWVSSLLILLAIPWPSTIVNPTLKMKKVKFRGVAVTAAPLLTKAAASGRESPRAVPRHGQCPAPLGPGRHPQALRAHSLHHGSPTWGANLLSRVLTPALENNPLPSFIKNHPRGAGAMAQQ